MTSQFHLAKNVLELEPGLAAYSQQLDAEFQKHQPTTNCALPYASTPLTDRDISDFFLLHFIIELAYACIDACHGPLLF